MSDPIQITSDYQRRLFQIFQEFFERATGSSATEFATFESFGSQIRNQAKDLAIRGESAFRWIAENLSNLYAKQAVNAFTAARQLGGMKVVLGGSSRFMESQQRAVSLSLLYADTILIPDPVMPWLEAERSEERFRHVLMLQSVFNILHLKPLVDADFRYPAVMTFPSFEKLLEQNDKQTQGGISTLTGDFFSYFLRESLGSMEEVRDFAERYPDQFLNVVDRNRLLIAPGGSLDDSLTQSLERYEKDVQWRRTGDWLSQFAKFPIHNKVFYAIAERLGPQYHLLENSEELGAHPLLLIPQQSHYFELVSKINSARLELLGLLDPQKKALIEGISHHKLKWLSNIPIDALVELRRNNENVKFRKRLETVVRQIHDSNIGNVSNVAAELSHEITSALADHDRAMESIQKQFNRKHSRTAVSAGIAFGATLMPSIAPFLGGVAPLALALKYAWDKFDERSAKAALSKSMIGIISTLRNVQK